MLAHPPERRRVAPCAEGIDGLRRLLRQYVRDGADATPDSTWRGPARVMCEDARARALRIEELLIGLKQVWATLTEAEGLPRDQSPRLLARVVTLCVEEFYAPLD